MKLSFGLRLMMAAAIAAAILAGVACGDDSDSTPTSAATNGSPIPATPVTATTTAAPTTGGTGYPAGTHTGVADLDAVIDTVQSGNATAIQALFVQTPSPCVINPQGIHNPPACPTGVAADTLLPVFRAAAGEAIWPTNLKSVVESSATRDRTLYAVFSSEGAKVQGGWVPTGKHAILLGDASKQSGALYFVEGGKIVGAEFLPWSALPLDALSQKPPLLPLR